MYKYNPVSPGSLVGGRAVLLLRAALLSGMLSLLSACGGQQEDSRPGQSGDAGSDTVTDTGEPASRNDSLSDDMYALLVDAQQYADRDADGIEDADDIYPDTAPVENADRPLLLDRISISVEGRELSDHLMQGRPVTVKLDDNAVIDINDSWLVFATPKGLRAVRAAYTASNTLQAVPPGVATAVHVVSGNTRSVSAPVQYLHAQSPVVFPVDAAYLAGSEVTVQGVNLDTVSALSFGETYLDVLARDATSLRFRLPAAPIGKRLTLHAGKLTSNSVYLRVYHEVVLSIADTLGLASGRKLAFYYQGQRQVLTAGESFLLRVPADKAALVHFDVLDADDTLVNSGELSTVIWPDEDAVEIDRLRSAQAYYLDNEHVYFPDAQWPMMKYRLRALVELNETAVYLSSLADLLAGNSSYIASQYRADMSAAYRAYLLENQPADNSAASYAKIPGGIPGKRLDDVLGTVLTNENSSSDETGEGEGASIVYTETTGNEFSQFLVIPHRARSLFFDDVPIINNFLQSCEVSEKNPPAGIWPSDLCIQMNGVVFSSVAVYMPGLMLDGQNDYKRSAPVRSHINFGAGHYAFDNIWGQGGQYLTADNGKTLCRMQTCFIEVLTSGLGIGINTPVTTNDQKIIDQLNFRMYEEAIMSGLTTVTSLISSRALSTARKCMSRKSLSARQSCYNGSENPGETKAGKCIIDLIYQDSDLKSRLVHLSATLLNTAAGNNGSGTGNVATVQTVISEFTAGIEGWAVQFFDMNRNINLKSCISETLGTPAASAFNTVMDRALKKGSSVGLVVEIVDKMLDYTQRIGSVAFTPRKFVFRMDSRARILAVSPEMLDTRDVSDRYLTIEGHWLYDNFPSNPDSSWTPELIIRDRAGREIVYQVKSDELSKNLNSGSLDYSIIRIPLARLKSDLDTLRQGPLEVKLSIDEGSDEQYDNGGYAFDSTNKMPVPVPSGVMTLRTSYLVDRFNPPVAQPGETVYVSGNDLDEYIDNADFILEDVNSGNQILLVEGSENSTGRLSFLLPYKDVLPEGEYRLKIMPMANIAGNLPQAESKGLLRIKYQDKPVVIAVADTGEVRDDTVEYRFFDSNGNEMTDLAMRYPIRSSIDGNGKEVEEYYDAKEIGDQDVATMIIDCKDPGDDSECTISIKIIGGLCMNVAGTLKDNENFLVSQNQTTEVVFEKLSSLSCE